MNLVYIFINGEQVEFLAGGEGVERNFLPITGSGFCESYEIILSLVKLVSSV